MYELFIAIAMLCQVGNGVENTYEIRRADALQVKCQRYYIGCTDKQNSLRKCILDRKIRSDD